MTRKESKSRRSDLSRFGNRSKKKRNLKLSQRKTRRYLPIIPTILATINNRTKNRRDRQLNNQKSLAKKLRSRLLYKSRYQNKKLLQRKINK
jgi:hypothetical protein